MGVLSSSIIERARRAIPITEDVCLEQIPGGVRAAESVADLVLCLAGLVRHGYGVTSLSYYH